MKNLIHYDNFYINNELAEIIEFSEFHPDIAILFEYCVLCSKCCGNYLRAKTIQGQKLFAEIR